MVLGDIGPNCLPNIIINIYTVLWTLVPLVGGILSIMASLRYSLTLYILAERPNLSANQAITLSSQYMNGHKWNLCVLYLSFVGWILLSLLTFGILAIWVIPHIECTMAIFYKKSFLAIWLETRERTRGAEIFICRTDIGSTTPTKAQKLSRGYLDSFFCLF